MRLKVTHALGDDDFPGGYAFSVEEGVLIVFRDHARTVAAKAYNRDVWAACEFVEVSGG